MDVAEKRLLLLSALDELNTAISYAILMENDGKAEVHLRDDQPCYGELRKYEKTHPGQCTGDQGKVGRPDDLNHPFPDGKPVGLVISFKSWVFHNVDLGVDPKDVDEYFSYFFSPLLSPFARGLGGQTEIIRQDDQVAGVILYDMRLDPTVLIDLLLLTKYLGFDDGLGRLSNYRRAGLSWEEAALATYTIYQDITVAVFNRYNHIAAMDPYVTSPKIDVRRFLAGDPLDLTGGLFEDRFDYNRPKIHDIFNPRKGDEIGVAERIAKKHGNIPKVEDALEEIREIVKEARM